MTFEKYHKIKILGNEDNDGIFADPDDEIIIEEKLDGGNFRFMHGKNGLIMGSRTRELDEDNKNSKSFKRCMEFVKERIQLSSTTTNNNYIFYGECMISHTMSYDWENIPPFLGFDIKDLESGLYLNYGQKQKLFNMLNLPMVPLIKVCKASDIKSLSDEDVPLTKYPNPSSKNLQAEGIVIKNYKKNLFAKHVRERFREEAKETFGDSLKWARLKGDNEALVATYCTNARIDKIIFKLLDYGNVLDMPLMALLPKEVISDIYEEHWNEICHSNWTIDFKEVRKKITRRCLSVLKQMITNNAIIHRS